MKRTIIAVSLLLAVGVGCDRGQDRQLPDGTKLFGERTLKDGTRTAKRKEFPDGRKIFNEAWLKDGTATAERVEFPDGHKDFNETWLEDGTVKAGRSESPDGGKLFNDTWLKDGTSTAERVESPNGEKDFDVTWLKDGTKKFGRLELPNGKKLFDVTLLPDGTQTAERLESPNGEKQFDVTWLKDDTKKVGRIESPDGKKQFDVTIAPSTVALLDSDPGWIAYVRKENGDRESVLREFSPEWNQIQAEIDKEVAGINDPSLRADERKRVSEHLLSEAKLNQLGNEAHGKLRQQETDYLKAHADDYRVIAGFSSEHDYSYPNPVMQIKTHVEGDGVLFYKGKQGDIRNTAQVYEKIEVKHFLRLTVHEMDGALTKFRTLKVQEISQGVASLAPYSTMVAAATGSAAMEEAGYRRATAEQVRATDAGLKEGDRKQAELGVWDRDIVLAARADMGTWPFELFVRKGSPIYLVDRATGTILTEVPKEAFCFKVEESVTRTDSSEDKVLHDCSLSPREQ
jgi:hypothetical protein